MNTIIIIILAILVVIQTVRVIFYKWVLRATAFAGKKYGFNSESCVIQNEIIEAMSETGPIKSWAEKKERKRLQKAMLKFHSRK